MANVKIDITLKLSLLDAQGRVVQSALQQLGFDDIVSVRIGRHVEVELPDSDQLDSKINDMCSKLLANPVIEDYRYEVEK